MLVSLFAKVALNNPDIRKVFHIFVLPWLERHVLGANRESLSVLGLCLRIIIIIIKGCLKPWENSRKRERERKDLVTNVN